jgi:hypothetical protein
MSDEVGQTLVGFYIASYRVIHLRDPDFMKHGEHYEFFWKVLNLK